MNWITSLDWSSILVAGVFVLGGLTTWMWGYHAGINCGRKMAIRYFGEREERRTREQSSERVFK